MRSKIHMFLKFDDNRSLPGRSKQPVTFQGMLEHNDLPGPLRVSLERRNAIDPNDYYVLDPNKTPAKAMWEAKIMSNIGLAAFCLTVLLGIIAWFLRPTTAAPANEGATIA